MPASVIQMFYTVEEGEFTSTTVEETYFLNTSWFLWVEGKVDAFDLVLSQSLCFLCWFFPWSKRCPKATDLISVSPFCSPRMLIFINGGVNFKLIQIRAHGATLLLRSLFWVPTIFLSLLPTLWILYMDIFMMLCLMGTFNKWKTCLMIIIPPRQRSRSQCSSKAPMFWIWAAVNHFKRYLSGLHIAPLTTKPELFQLSFNCT